ncbi:ATP-binding cassette domain-containing protein [Desulfoplanes formicivorans]|uniref:ABC transporter n=1 Tax=Desulfoplanes formicivorans TaxID=1592317 RepID=A0A194AHD8_9BACT|nr:ATP-binding cassette domain-containing protein [Desulfoplanes formicivorans]GAU08501.1 ABC transporter [Desulfoplanes formicivorans]
MNPSLQPAIDVRNLTKTFGQVRAVDNLSFTIMPGEVFGLVGPDGAGKTTTLRLLATILAQDEGTATVAGFDTQARPDAVKDRLAYMSQRFGLYPDLTVQENIDFYADLYGEPKRGRAKRIHELLDFSNMTPFTRRQAGNLSGGMKQKLQLVCALIHTPKVLLLDEPTNGVDPVSRRDFWRILYRLLADQVAILVSTSYLDEAERCSRIGLLHHGSFMATGTPGQVRSLLPGHVVAVRSPNARALRNIMKGVPGISGVEVFGDRVHAVCANVQETEKRIRSLLARDHIPFEDITELSPGLEDVFVELLRGEGTSGEADGERMPGAAPDSQTPQPPAVSPTSKGLLQHEPAVVVDHLTRRFGTFTAVNNVSFTVPRGEIFGFLGPNGAGKSTTIKMLCGLLVPSSGTGRVLGLDIARDPEKIKMHIGYMSQKFSLYDDLTVAENIDFYGGIYGLSGDHLAMRRKWAVSMAGLEGREASLTATLAAGWKQRLAMACAVLHEPPILFLDEPTSGVDPLSRRMFWDLITSMAESGVTVFVTTHYMEEAEYCDRIALIYKGAMIALGTPAELKTGRMHDVLLHLACEKPQELMDDLANLPTVRDVALFGAGLHLVGWDEQAIRRDVDALMTRQRHLAYSLERITPSMEDVFVSLIEETDRNQEQGT